MNHTDKLTPEVVPQSLGCDNTRSTDDSTVDNRDSREKPTGNNNGFHDAVNSHQIDSSIVKESPLAMEFGNRSI
jgi:hypothetical protein